jgi:hypothetical protein
LREKCRMIGITVLKKQQESNEKYELFNCAIVAH